MHQYAHYDKYASYSPAALLYADIEQVPSEETKSDPYFENLILAYKHAHSRYVL